MADVVEPENPSLQTVPGQPDLVLSLLGPVTLYAGDVPIDVPGRHPRALLALLGLEAERLVSTTAIIERLWTDPPPSGRNSVQSHLSHLRRALRPVPGLDLVRQGDSYRLTSHRLTVDAREMEEAIRVARSADDPHQRLADTDRALAWWVGTPLDGIGDGPFAETARRRFQRLRQDALALRIEALIALGQPGDAASAADDALNDDPFDEALWSMAVTARYQAGRSADALRCYQRARRLLADELGIEPSQRLRALEQAILHHDATLSPDAIPVAVPPRPEGRPPIRLVVADDDLLVREGIVGLLSRQSDFQVAAAAGDRYELLSAVDVHRPDVVVTDVRMPPEGRRDGILAAHQLRTSHPGVGVIVLSQFADPCYARDLFTPRAEGRGYLLKGGLNRNDQLAGAVRQVAAGGSFLDPTIVDLLVAGAGGPGPGDPHRR